MKRLRDLIALLAGLKAVWPVVVTFLVLLASLILWIAGVGSRILFLRLPLPLFIALIALALYPVAKFLQLIISRSRIASFRYAGLLWQPSLFSFRLPKPLCPHIDCGREIVYKVRPPPPVQLVRGMRDFEKSQIRNRYIYECPIHGVLERVPDEPIYELSEKAKIVQRDPNN